MRAGLSGYSPKAARYSPVEIASNGMEPGATGDSTTPTPCAGSYSVRLDSGGQLWRMLYQPMGR